MPAWVGQMAQQIGGQAAGTAMGIAAQRIGKNYDRKQWIKDFEVQAPRQMEMERRIMELQQQNQMEMWNNTNYGAQMEHIKKAGLNPAMIYGMSGGGGTTAGGIGGGAPPTRGTSTGTGSGIGGAGIGMGVLTAAQVKLMEAQARNLNVDADKKAGVDTENVKADTGLKLANTGNTKADTQLKEIGARIMAIDEAIRTDTKTDVEDRIFWEAKRSMEEVERLRWSNDLSKEQFTTQVDLIKAELAGKYIQNALGRAATANVKADTKNKGLQSGLITQQTISEMANRMQAWRELGIKERKIEIDKFLQEQGLDIQSNKMWLDGLMDIINMGTRHKGQESYDEFESEESGKDNDGAWKNKKRSRRY